MRHKETTGRIELKVSSDKVERVVSEVDRRKGTAVPTPTSELLREVESLGRRLGHGRRPTKTRSNATT